MRCINIESFIPLYFKPVAVIVLLAQNQAWPRYQGNINPVIPVFPILCRATKAHKLCLPTQIIF